MLRLFTFRFKGTNLGYQWWHYGNEQCYFFNKTYTMGEQMGCASCGFCPAESHRTEEPLVVSWWRL